MLLSNTQSLWHTGPVRLQCKNGGVCMYLCVCVCIHVCVCVCMEHSSIELVLSPAQTVVYTHTTVQPCTDYTALHRLLCPHTPLCSPAQTIMYYVQKTNVQPCTGYYVHTHHRAALHRLFCTHTPLCSPAQTIMYTHPTVQLCTGYYVHTPLIFQLSEHVCTIVHINRVFTKPFVPTA